jgi:hypothetical protein
MKRLTAVFAAVLGTISAAQAVPIIYTTTGTGSANIGGTVYTGSFVETAIGETAIDYNPNASIAALRVDSLRITIGGVTALTIDPVFFFTNQAAHFPTGTIGGFVQYDPVKASLSDTDLFASLAFTGYDGTTALGPVDITAQLLPQTTRITDKGAFLWVGTPTYSKFSAAFPAAPVPEPETWALAIIGLSAVGITLRRKNRPSAAA